MLSAAEKRRNIFFEQLFVPQDKKKWTVKYIRLII